MLYFSIVFFIYKKSLGPNFAGHRMLSINHTKSLSSQDYKPYAKKLQS